MTSRSKSASSSNSEKGQVLVTVAVSMVALLSFAGLAVDLGHLYVTRNAVQNVADGSALAGTRALGNIYQGLTYELQQGYTCGVTCQTTILDAAQDVASSNRAAGVNMSVRAEDVAIGEWDGDNFTPTLFLPDAVQVLARRDDVANGPVTSFFARIFGVDASAISTIAVAALSGQSTADSGEIELPIGISDYFFDDAGAFCNEDIQFYPTNDPASCAGWTSWEYGSNDITLRRILQENPAYDSPETIAGQSIFNFTGGTLSNPTFDDLLSLFQIKGYDVDANWEYLTDASGNPYHQDPAGRYPLYELGADGLPVLDADGNMIQLLYPDGTPRNMHKWETSVPVYERGDCSNPNQSIRILGFAGIELRDVLNAPNKLVRGTVECNLVDLDASRGGGGEYGTKGSIPGLVR